MHLRKELSKFYGGEIPLYVVNAGKTYFTVTVGHVVTDEPRKLKIRLQDVVDYYCTQAASMSGMRQIAGHYGDWRYIDRLTQEVLDWFKFVNIEGMRWASKKAGLIPKF